MAGTTTDQAIPYPTLTDAPDAPAQVLALLGGVERRLVRVYASIADRTTRAASPVEGAVCWLQDLNRFEFYTGSAWIPKGVAKCTVRLRRAANQSIGTGAVTSISWDTEDEDTHGFWSSGANVVIPANLGGLYAVSFRVLTGSSATGRCFTRIIPTGGAGAWGVTGMADEFREGFDGSDNRGQNTPILQLAAADSLVFQAFHSAAGSINFTAALQLSRIGD